MSCVTISRIALLAIVAANGSMLTAQQAKVRIKVHPPEAQIFVDGKTQGKGPAKEIKTTAGVHTVIVVNYGTSLRCLASPPELPAPVSQWLRFSEGNFPFWL